MMTAPYPPESRTTTSPPGLTAAIAAAKFRQGKAREQGFVSAPEVAETQVRTVCASTPLEEIVRTAKRSKVQAWRIDQSSVMMKVFPSTSTTFPKMKLF